MWRDTQLYRLYDTWMPHSSDSLSRTEIGQNTFRYDLFSKELAAHPTTRELRQYIAHLPSMRAVKPVDKRGNSISLDAWIDATFLAKSMSAFFHRDLEQKPAEVIIGELYAQLEQALFDLRSVELVCKAEIENLRLEKSPFEIAPGVTIRRKDTFEMPLIDELQWFPRGDQVPGEIFEMQLLAGEEATLSSPISESALSTTERALENFLLSLRLLAPEPVRTTGRWIEIRNEFLADQMYKQREAAGPLDSHANLFVIDSDKAVALSELLIGLSRAYQAGIEDSEWSLATTRLGDAYRRSKAEDQLIDYWIALEALFLPKERTPDMGIAAALAISHYLGKTVQERRSIYELVKASHTLRSDVVHPKPGLRDKQFDAKVTKTASLLRRALRQRIDEYSH